jgi:predicted dehydrogenase/threonine dehydrogenase-like Zn-dependent dehydrogenase
MIQAIVKKGKVLGEQVPAPIVSKGSLLIKVVYSCISAGTELSGVTDSGKSLIQKALDQPEKIRKAFNILKNEGLNKTISKLKGLSEDGRPTGYSISGIVIGIGEGVSGYFIGEPVSAAGAGIANHAEFVDVPQNLVIRLPKGMDLKLASTVTLGGIAMQGVRRADLRIGEFAVVTGAGILGLLSVQMLVKSGIRVACIDLDENRLTIAADLGAEIILNPLVEKTIDKISHWTGGFGTDAVLFTAATSSSVPLSESFQMCKKKGKVVLVGVVGMEIKREDMYTKELDFQISTSYGPGRYDSNYEEKGLDYPYAYVRWTENRNMQEYLRLVNQGTIKLNRLIDKTYEIKDVSIAFESLTNDAPKPLMVLLSYGMPKEELLAELLFHERKIEIKKTDLKDGVIQVAVVGTGGFATGMHLPNLKSLQDKYNIRAIVNRTGYKAKEVAEKFGADYFTTDIEDVLKDENIHLVLICTRHDSHSELSLKALNAGKHVFVEKPLATTKEELEKIESFYKTNEKESKPLLFVGFNRRFSKYATEIKRHTSSRVNPLFIQYRMNAGYIPYDNWVHESGGRIVGEACHIIDLMTYLTESTVQSISVESLDPTNEKYHSSDNKSVVLKYADGSISNIQYFSCGSTELPKEYMEIHFDGKSIVMDDYKSLKGYGLKIQETQSTISQKGQLEELHVLYDCLRGPTNRWPIDLWDIVQTTKASFLINENN